MLGLPLRFEGAEEGRVDELVAVLAFVELFKVVLVVLAEAGLVFVVG